MAAAGLEDGGLGKEGEELTPKSSGKRRQSGEGGDRESIAISIPQPTSSSSSSAHHAVLLLPPISSSFGKLSPEFFSALGICRKKTFTAISFSNLTFHPVYPVLESEPVVVPLLSQGDLEAVLLQN